MWNHLQTVDSFQLMLLQSNSSLRDCKAPTTLLRNNPGPGDIRDTTINESNKEDSLDIMEPLDVVLERARKRKPSWVLKGVAFLNSPVGVNWFAKSDLVLASIAVFLGSYGFFVGYVLGKWMTSPENQNRFRNGLASGGDDSLSPLKPWQQALLFQYWPVFLAIVLDQVFSFF